MTLDIVGDSNTSTYNPHIAEQQSLLLTGQLPSAYVKSYKD